MLDRPATSLRSMLDRLTTGDRVVVISGLALAVSAFLPWYAIGGASDNGWDFVLLGVVPVLLGLALVAHVALTRLWGARLPELPVTWARAQAAAGGVVLLLVGLRFAFPEKIDFVIGELTLERQYGLFLALVAAIGVAVGGYLRLREDEP
jgi:hypothetical protein